MYYSYFGLRQPRSASPRTPTSSSRAAIAAPSLEALIYAITQGEGIVKVTGEVGSGKTMLCRVLQARLPQTVETIYLANPSVSPDEILHAIAFELQLPLPRTPARLEVMHALQEYLLSGTPRAGRWWCSWRNRRACRSRRSRRSGCCPTSRPSQHKLLQIVLFGQPELDDNLRKPEIRQLRERITHSFAAHAAQSGRSARLPAFRLRAAGYHGPDLFPSRLTGYMTRATGGLNRRINIVADKALLAAFADNTHNVAMRHVKAAVQDSEFSDATPVPSRRPRRRWAAAAAVGALVVAAAVGAISAYHYLQPVGPARLASVPPAAPPSPATSEPPAAAPAAVVPASASEVTPAVNTATKESEIPHPGISLPPSAGRAQPNEPVVSAAAPGTSRAVDLLEQRLLATQRWLAEEQGSVYSIQLLGSNDPQMLRSYLETLTNYIEIDKIFVYRTTANREPIMTVLYGAFAGRAEAIKSLDALPAELKANRPYIRTVQGIRSELGLSKPS